MPIHTKKFTSTIYFTIFTFLTLASLFFSCQQGPKQQAPIDSTVLDTSGLVPEPKLDTGAKDLQITDIPLQAFPFHDSTNFDNYNNEGIVDPTFIHKIGFKPSQAEAKEIYIRYRLDYSPDFYTIMLTYHVGEMELFSTLVNLNKDLQIVDQLEATYDEIAESAARKEVNFLKNKFTILDWNYMSEKPIKLPVDYRITKAGKFQDFQE